jgi:hypothetical protein
VFTAEGAEKSSRETIALLALKPKGILCDLCGKRIFEVGLEIDPAWRICQLVA